MAAAPSWNDGRCGFLACTAPPSAPCDASARQTLSQRDRMVFEVPEGWVLAPLGTTPSASRQQPQWPQLPLQRPQAQQPQWQQPLRQPQQQQQQQQQWQQPQWQQPQWQQPPQQQPMPQQQQQPALQQPFMQQPARQQQQQQQQQQQAFLQASSLLPLQHQSQQSLLQRPLQQSVAQVQQVQPPQRQPQLTQSSALPLVESGSQAPQRLTRGARRHLKQRLRKKLGKLERARAAAELAAQDELAEEADFAAECGSQCCGDHCEEHWSDSDSTEAPHSQHSPMSSLWTSEEDESENQDIPSYAIKDLMHIPADAFSGLPQEWEASAVEEHCIQSRGRSPCRMECLPHAVPLSAIPSKNTFVHFPMERVQPPRRSRSV